MLPNFHTQSAVLRKVIKQQFDIDIPHHQALATVARMNGFSDYQSLRRGAEKVSQQLFIGNVLHTVFGPSYFCGEDAVAFILGHLFNMMSKGKYFAVDARGTKIEPGIKRENWIGREALSPAQHREQVTDDDVVHWSHPAHGLILDSEIFEEVTILREGMPPAEKTKHLLNCIQETVCNTGLIVVGSDDQWNFVSEISSHTSFTPVYHLSISYNYILRGRGASMVSTVIDRIKKADPTAVIVCWLFEHDDASNGVDSTAQRIIYSEQSSIGDRYEVPDLGFVRSVGACEFYKAILNTLRTHDIPFLQVPYFKGRNAVYARNPHNTLPVTAQISAEQDRIAQALLVQMVDKGMMRLRPDMVGPLRML
jgi:hypothetical protein